MGYTLDPFSPLSCGIIAPIIIVPLVLQLVTIIFINHFKCTFYISWPLAIFINMGSSP